MYNFHKFGIDVNGRTSGKLKTFCPKCRDSRKNKRDKSLSVNLDTGLFKCHYCDFAGTAAEREPRNSYTLPCRSKQHSAADRAAGRQRIANSQNGVAGIVISASLPGKLLCTAESQPAGQSAATDSLSVAIAAKADATNISTNATAANATASNAMVAALRWFTAERGISAEAVAALHISHSQEFMPQTGRKESCVCFNYFERGELVNTKFRDGRKNFKMTTGAELIPYNIDSIEDTPQCIITEGEVDALSFVTVGRTDVVSVPSGANKNLTWLDRFVESHFENKDVIYLAVDNDRKGLELQQELLRRLGRERCRILTYGEGCKDANEHLLKYGANSLLKTIEEAPEQPLEGVYTADDVADDLRTLFENGFSSGAPTGLETLDRNLTFELGRLCVVTGVPGSGKSEFIDELVLRLCLRHGWKPAFFSPENLPLVYHLRKLAEKLTGRLFVPFSTSESLYRRLVNYLTDNVCHILPKDDFTAETILEKARELVRRRGIRTFVFDPFNRLEHLIPDGMSETQYISAFLDKLTNFAVRNNCLVILVAHPRKMNRDAQTGRTPVPTLYDINGSAAFFNKCDFGLTVERDTDVVRIHVQKVKFRHLGQPGIVPFVFNTVNGRYTPCDEDPTASTPAQRITNVNFDCESWLPEMTDDLFS